MPRLFTLVSIAIHAVVITFVVIAQVFDIGPLPLLRHALAYDAGSIVKVADVPVSPPARRADAAAPAVTHDTAPVVAPDSIAPDTERPPAPSTLNPGVIGGIEGGGAGLLGPGVIAGGSAPPPPPQEPPAEPLHLHSGIEPPHKIVDVAPQYPALARAARQQGVVILETIIDAHGSVSTVRVLRGDPLLDDAAVEAVRQWRFTPALLNGKPVPVVMTVTVNFALQ